MELPFNGSPQPKVTWQFNDGPIMVDNITEETIRNMTCIRMKNVKRSDGGDYSVTLENKSGKCTMTVKVIVIGKYMVFMFLPVPNANIYWLPIISIIDYIIILIPYEEVFHSCTCNWL